MLLSRKMTAFGVVAVGALTAGTILVSAAPRVADKDDKFNPVNTTIKGTSGSTVFSVPAGTPVITVTCTNSVAGGKTPAKGLTLKISPLPTFNDGTGKPCTDNLNGTETTVTKGAWTLTFLDAANDESKTEPNTGDRMQITVPIGGAVVSTSEGCTITVAPTAPFKVIGTYDDKNKLTVTLNNLPIKVVGGALCPTTATTSSFAGTYTFTPNVGDAS